MAELAWKEINGNLALGVRILGGRDAIIRAGNRVYIANRNPDTAGKEYCGSLYPIELLRTFAPPTSVPCFDGHLDYNRNWHNQSRIRLGEVRQIHWAEHDQSLRGWWFLDKAFLRWLLESEQEGKLPDISGDCRVSFEPLNLGESGNWKLATKIENLVSVDVVDVSTGGGKILRQSEVGTIKRVRLSAGGRILGQKEVRT